MGLKTIIQDCGEYGRCQDRLSGLFSGCSNPNSLLSDSIQVGLAMLRVTPATLPWESARWIGLLLGRTKEVASGTVRWRW
jgi:hypothetical protein